MLTYTSGQLLSVPDNGPLRGKTKMSYKQEVEANKSKRDERLIDYVKEECTPRLSQQKFNNGFIASTEAVMLAEDLYLLGMIDTVDQFIDIIKRNS